MTRVLSGISLIAVFLGIVNYGSHTLIAIVVAAVMLLGLWEYFGLIKNFGLEGYPLTASVLSLLLVACFYYEGTLALEWMALGLITLFFRCIWEHPDISKGFQKVAFSLFGIVYLAGMLAFFIPIHALPHGKLLIFLLFLIIWLGDTLALVFGKTLGRTPFFPSISPKKTWEGAVGGLAGSLLGGVVSHFLFLNEISLNHCLIVALICGMIGQLGDMAESILKRNAGVKDSGSVIPGHGGVLDRIDSLLFSAPVFYGYFKFAVF